MLLTSGMINFVVTDFLTSDNNYCYNIITKSVGEDPGPNTETSEDLIWSMWISDA